MLAAVLHVAVLRCAPSTENRPNTEADQHQLDRDTSSQLGPNSCLHRAMHNRRSVGVGLCFRKLPGLKTHNTRPDNAVPPRQRVTPRCQAGSDGRTARCALGNSRYRKVEQATSFLSPARPVLGVPRGWTGDTGTLTPQAPPEVERFFSLIANVPHWPKGVVPVPARIGPPAFFSASDGLWHNPDEQAAFPYGGVMVVGHNLDSEESYRARLASGESHGGEANRMPTWRNLLRSLESAHIHPAECFFTNAYVGLRNLSTSLGQVVREISEVRAWGCLGAC